MKHNPNKSYIPKAGDIVAWSNEQKCTSIAVMISEDEFSVCLNFRGRKDEEDRVWEFDSTPTNRIIRKADKFEMAWLFAELISQGYEIHGEGGKVVVPLEEPEEDYEPEPEKPEIRVECIILNRNERFAKYIYELAELYERQGSFRMMSDLARKNNISSIKKDTCYRVGLNELRDKEWLKTREGLSFCDNLYEYALHHTNKYPIIPQSQRV